MDKCTFGIVILVGLSAAAAAFSHSFIRSFILASVAAALASTALFQVVSFVELGHLDKFFPIAVVVGAVYAFLISIPVGFVVRRIRSQRQ